MNSSSTSRIAILLNEKKLKQLSYLGLLLVAMNKACIAREGIAYMSGSGSKGKPLTEFQKFLTKLALICDTVKGEYGRTMTALVCLRGINGPDYIFTSNFRKEAELEEAKSFLSSLLTFVGTNPDSLMPKALQKQVLWKILVFNFSKLEFYLGALVDALDNCIECERLRRLPDSEAIKELYFLKEKANFPRDITSSGNAKNKFLRDCEALIKAIQACKTGSFEKILQSRAVEKNADSEDWCRLRHYLGRLHSYRQASEIIVAAATSWPDLFKNHRVDYVPSAHTKYIPTPNSSSFSEIIPIALPGHKASDFESDIAQLEVHGLDNIFQEQLQKRRLKTMVHGEVNLHNHLVQKGKINSTDFWSGAMFIATSKPTCRLCYYYFDNSTNDFQVQTSHMNVYPKWRFPDIYEDQGPETKEGYEELLQDLIVQMEHDMIQMLKRKEPRGKTNDSRTDSHSRVSTRVSSLGDGLRNIPSELAEERQAANRRLPSPPFEDDESFSDLGDTVGRAR
ncbi:hypothetical protein FP744_10009292 [Trichoderma asperellum]|nr:hypothetical protein LI328DRAFT_162206 [Trichoderma asperelloides]